MKRIACITLLLVLSSFGWEQVLANKFILRDGRIIEGRMARLSRVDERDDAPQHIARPIVVIDDGLRWTYLSTTQIARIIEEATPRPETFRTGQRVNRDGREYFIPGTYLNSTPFDRYGRRILEIRHPGGVELAEQAIVELNPYFISVTGLRATHNGINQPLNWNKRIATNAIPREQISAILMQIIDPQGTGASLDDRMRLASFYLRGGHYRSADAELEAIAQDWQDSPEALQRIRPLSLQVRRGLYSQLLAELDFRWESGQYQFVRQFIDELEQDPRLPELLLVSVRRFIQRYDETDAQSKRIVSALRELYEQLPESQKSEKIPPIIAEIERELNFSTLRRLSQFQLFMGETQIPAAERLALAITGWYAGPDVNNSQLAIALMLPETEQLITDYLRSGQNNVLRQRILEELKNLETARPDIIAGILATMKPPFAEDLPPENPEFPGYYRLTVPNPLVTAGASRLPRGAEIRYAVQLPPDYNPHLRYPMIVSLNGLAQTPDMQIDWWAGSWSAPRDGGEAQERGGISPPASRMRTGHATRYGYIVIAPEWNPARLPEYDFSVFSHSAVLLSVKDAFRRFSVNTDKVFISGHGIGGTAAWDMALAHPDLWAGAIPFNAVASKYIDAYDLAVYHVPFYFVWGEMEGIGATRKWTANAVVMNRYLLAQARPGDVQVVRYIGRGMEGFSEEILNILDWMRSRHRDMVPSEFSVQTMRPWDSFFWWVEMPNLHRDREVARNMIDPMDFPATRGGPRLFPVTVESRVYRATNTLRVTTRPTVRDIQIFLTPHVVDFRERARIRVNDRDFHPPNGILEPDIEVMLEDVRTRGDRLHPFWVKLEGR